MKDNKLKVYNSMKKFCESKGIDTKDVSKLYLGQLCKFFHNDTDDVIDEVFSILAFEWSFKSMPDRLTINGVRSRVRGVKIEQIRDQKKWFDKPTDEDRAFGEQYCRQMADKIKRGQF
jgi:hypothetical protein